MCRKTMDFKPKPHLKSDCVRRIIHPRLSLRLLRVTVDQDTGLSHWRSNIVKSTIRKCIHKERKRVQLARMAKTTEESGKIDEIHEETNATASAQQRPPLGAMAPENTTQYLMSKVYEDLPQDEHVLSFTAVLPQSEELGLWQNANTTPERSYDACLSFQQRDFDELYASHPLGGATEPRLTPVCPEETKVRPSDMACL